MNPAYVVGHVRVLDAQKWAEYQARVPATLAPWGAELMFRGRQVAAFSGQLPHTDVVVIRFASVADAQAWFSSAAYQALLPLRAQAADVLLLAYQA